MGPPRHLALVAGLCPQAARHEWPVPFAAGYERLLQCRGTATVVLASGAPFWHGAGVPIASRLEPGEWRCLPAPSTFSLAAARLAWPLERCVCLGLHAKPLTNARRHVAPGARMLVYLRDGEAVREWMRLLSDWGFGETTVHVLEALGGGRERVRVRAAAEGPPEGIEHPVLVGVEIEGTGDVVPLTPGISEERFEHDGQITKGPVRALTLAALAPRPGERLWDLGAGAGSVAIEWLLRAPSLSATAIERDPDRAERARRNAARFGVKLDLREGSSIEMLDELPLPHAVFIGGGLSEELLGEVWARLPPGARLVTNAVTLESQQLVMRWSERVGGDLLRIDLARPRSLGRRHAWQPAIPLVQWSAQRGMKP